MRHLTGILMLAAATTGCGEVDDARGLPDAPTAITSCAANEFVDCAGDTLRVCNATGTGSVDTACGVAGCNAAAQRCNTCAAGQLACTTDGALAACGDDGQPTGTPTACTIGCIDATADAAAHCGVVEPPIAALAGICAEPAAIAEYALTASYQLDTSDDAQCTGGIVEQTDGAPAICVVRAGAISFGNDITVTVSGTRALALVADSAVTIEGTIDASARTAIDGPGGGTRVQTSGPGASTGGGGAGWRTAGAAGGDATTAGGAANGGAALTDPAEGALLLGGVRAGATARLAAASGGGGGAVALIACRGSVRVIGLGSVRVSGGGGGGGHDVRLGRPRVLVPGAGGGSGGYALFAGLQVELAGELWANGGGGGGATSEQDSDGELYAGTTGSRSSTKGADGGAAEGTGGRGGDGSCAARAPTPGQPATTDSQGGGGASMGFLQTYTPPGVAPVLSLREVSPPLSTHRDLAVR